jgi:hypothetical protein
VVSVAGGFCVVSGRDVMLGMGMFITDSSYMLIMVVVKAMGAAIDLDGAFGFVACRSVHVLFAALAFSVFIGLFNIVVLLFIRRQ